MLHEKPETQTISLLTLGRPLPWGGGGKRRKRGQPPGQRPQQWLSERLPSWLPKKMPNLQPFWVILAPPGQPDKKRLMTVQDFFKYTEEEGGPPLFSLLPTAPPPDPQLACHIPVEAEDEEREL